MEGHAEGVERGMVVEMSPRLGAEELNGAVEDGRGGYQQTKGCRIERGNIVEMHNLGSPSHQTANAIGCHDNHAEGQEYQQMNIGKEVNELTDGIIWRDLRQKFFFVNPAKGELVAGHFHPDGIDSVGRNGHNVCHHDVLVLTERDGILLLLLADGFNLNTDHIRNGHRLWLLGDDDQGVTRHDKVVVLGVVVGGVEGDGVELLLRQVPGIGGDGATVITSTKKNAQCTMHNAQ